MIPQLQERIMKCESSISEIDEGVRRLSRDLAQLREQLQVERLPENKLAEPCMVSPEIDPKPYRY